MLLGFDHTILVVNDLEKTVADFTTLGFEVAKRADAGKGPSENRLIVFEDGSYLEILHLAEPDYARKHRFAPLLASGEGWADFSLHTDAIEADRDRLQAAGLPNTRPPDYSKKLEDGAEWTVRLVQAGRGVGRLELPFFAEDGTPRSLRIPSGKTDHPNGARGTAGIRLVTDDLAGLAPQMDAMLAVAGQDLEPVAGAAVKRWTFGGGFVEALQPGDAASDAATHLAARGPSIYEVVLASGKPGGLLDMSKSHGCRLLLG